MDSLTMNESTDSLEDAIQNARNDPQRFMELLPRMLSVDTGGGCVSDSLRRAATEGNLGMYKILAPLMFNYSNRFGISILGGLWKAIDSRHQALADAMLNDAITHLDGPYRSLCFSKALSAAVEVDNSAVFDRVLQLPELRTDLVKRALFIACARENVDMTTRLIIKIMTSLEADVEYWAQRLGLNRNDGAVLTKALAERGFVIQNAIRVVLKPNRSPTARRMTEVLLSPYIECLMSMPPPSETDDFLKYLEPEEFLYIPRQRCLRLLTRDVSCHLRNKICLRLAIPSEEPEAKRVNVRTTHRLWAFPADILAFWSPWFANVLRDSQLEGDHIPLNDVASDPVLDRVFSFMAWGIFSPEGAEDADQLADDVLRAAEFFGIELLKQKVLSYQRQRNQA
ncbi:hypothetical protein BJX61DRAFT_541566 [Aspergillus egyptiacus]|nr:hypothetical protein BJX61DRAFT_541566 [Aspergillus egyptiacus]